VITMTADGGLRCGTIRTAWISDGMAHVLEHAGTDEAPGTWTGLACAARGLAIGTDVDPAILRDLCSGQRAADITWEPPSSLVGEDHQAFRHQPGHRNT
jgi:hypothetical protein